MSEDLSHIWKALADETRRTILDHLRSGPCSTTELVDQIAHLSRFAVMKHLDVLREAGLVLTREEGRRRINSLNAVPIRQIYERWVSHFADHWANTLLRVKESAEKTAKVRGRRNATKNAGGAAAPSKRARDEPSQPQRRQLRDQPARTALKGG